MIRLHNITPANVFSGQDDAGQTWHMQTDLLGSSNNCLVHACDPQNFRTSLFLQTAVLVFDDEHKTDGCLILKDNGTEVVSEGARYKAVNNRWVRIRDDHREIECKLAHGVWEARMSSSLYGIGRTLPLALKRLAEALEVDERVEAEAKATRELAS